MRRGSRVCGSPLTSEEISWDRRGASGAWKGAQQLVGGRQDSETYTEGPCQSTALPSLRQMSAGAHRGCVLEHGIWRADQGRGLRLAVRRQPEGTGVRSSTIRNAHGGSQDHHRSNVPVLSDAQWVGPPLQPFSSSASPCLHEHLGGLPPEPAHVALQLSSLPPHLPAWATCSPRSLPDGLACSNCYPSVLPPGWPAHPNCCLGSFLPDGLVYSSNLWSRLQWEEHMQRWG